MEMLCENKIFVPDSGKATTPATNHELPVHSRGDPCGRPVTLWPPWALVVARPVSILHPSPYLKCIAPCGRPGVCGDASALQKQYSRNSSCTYTNMQRPILLTAPKKLLLWLLL